MPNRVLYFIFFPILKYCEKYDEHLSKSFGIFLLPHFYKACIMCHCVFMSLWYLTWCTFRKFPFCSMTSNTVICIREVKYVQTSNEFVTINSYQWHHSVKGHITFLRFLIHITTFPSNGFFSNYRPTTIIWSYPFLCIFVSNGHF